MKILGGALALVAAVALAPSPSQAQTVGAVFRQVTPSVVVIRARGREVSEGSVVGYSETGSGVLISADGKVVTAAHVVNTTDAITVEVVGGDTVSARIIASEPAADLSMLQLERVPKGAQVAKLSNSDTVRVGDQVLVVGAPYGLSYSLSVGYISARWAPNTVYRSMPLAEFFQTDAVINTGNSGGPLFNMAGEVVGIVSHNISKGGGSEGLGFVVTWNTARQLLLEKRSVWTGLEGEILTERQADILNCPPGVLGYIVKVVAKGSPAEALGVRGGDSTATIDGRPLVVGGDIIISVNGIPVRSAADLVQIRDAVNRLPPDQRIKAEVLRRGRIIELSGKLE
jgi:serine protease Do